MNTNEIEQEIERLLATESSAIVLSEKVFSQDGLFSKLASNIEQRKELVRSSLYQRAQKRFRELQFKEMDAFHDKVEQWRNAGVEKETAVKLERIKTA
jgi:hypothetical protein